MSCQLQWAKHLSLCAVQQQWTRGKHLSVNTFWEQAPCVVRIHSEQSEFLSCWNVTGKANRGVFQNQSVLKEKKGGEKCVITWWFRNECLKNDSGACAGCEVGNWILSSGLLHPEKLWLFQSRVCWQPQSELISNFSTYKIKHKRFLNQLLIHQKFISSPQKNLIAHYEI